MKRPNARNTLARLLAVTSVLAFTVVTAPTYSFAAPVSDDIPACDADDPDFGTNCAEAEDEENEVRDGYLDSSRFPET